MKLDDLDHKILQALRNDARSPAKEIAKAIHSRPSTVHQRIQRLVEHRIIERYTLQINRKALGEELTVFMFLSASKVVEGAFRKDVVKEVHRITGEFDYMVKLRFSGISMFNDFVVAFKKDYDVQNVVTMIATESLKEET